MLMATAPREAIATGEGGGSADAPLGLPPAAARPRPKRPAVLLTTASTGEGVPELLAALDAHRAEAREGLADGARLARAERQVWAVLADRLRERLASAGDGRTEAIFRAVATHELDPYEAADRLLATLAPIADG
jgi:putative protein kinase ArgK-like GTPase of G3E family